VRVRLTSAVLELNRLGQTNRSANAKMRRLNDNLDPAIVRSVLGVSIVENRMA